MGATSFTPSSARSVRPRLPRPRSAPGPGRRGEGDQALVGRGPRLGAEFRARGAAPGQRQRPGHRPDLRRRLLAARHLLRGRAGGGREPGQPPRGRTTRARTVGIAGQLARALATAHLQRVVHRDIKPANVLISYDGRVKVADFGVARLAEGSTDAETGTVVGTPRYMAPEQAQGGQITPATDVLWRWRRAVRNAVRAPALRRLGGRARAIRHVNEAPPPLAPEPGRAGHVVARALAKDPDDRYARCRGSRGRAVGGPRIARLRGRGRGGGMPGVLALGSVARLWLRPIPPPRPRRLRRGAFAARRARAGRRSFSRARRTSVNRRAARQTSIRRAASGGSPCLGLVLLLGAGMVSVAMALAPVTCG